MAPSCTNQVDLSHPAPTCYQEQDSYFLMMDSRLPPDLERKGVSFAELEQFFRLLRNMEDFSLAFKLYPKAGR